MGGVAQWRYSEQLFLYNIVRGVLGLVTPNHTIPFFYSDFGEELNAYSNISFEAALEGLLSRFPLGLRTDQIRSALAREGVHRSLPEIARTLRELSESKKIRFEHQKWVSVSRIVDKKPLPSPFSRPQPKITPIVKMGANDDTTWVKPDDLKHIRCIHFGYKRFDLSHEVGVEADSDSNLPSGWELLRSLAPYYGNCLRVEERSNMTVGPDKSGELFVAITSTGKWWPTRNQAVSFTFKMSELPNAFLKELSRRGDKEIFVGYPVSITSDSSGGVLLHPIFTLNCRVGAISGDLKVYVPPQMPDINSGWFNRFFKDRNDGLTFLRWIGINGVADGEHGEVGANQEFVEISDAAARFNAFVGTEHSVEFFPERLSETLRLSIDRAFTENVCMLFLAPLTRYTEESIRELSSVAEWGEKQLEKTSLSTLFGEDVPDKTDRRTPVLTPISLNESQLNSVKAALESAITVITAPPGTGKSHAVAAIMASAALIGKSVLLASKNQKALDAIERRLDGLNDDRCILTRAGSHYGSERPFDLKACIEATLSGNVSQQKIDHFRDKISTLKLLDGTRWELYEKLKEIDQLQGLLANKRESVADLTGRLGEKAVDWVKGLPRGLDIQDLQEIPGRYTRIPFLGKSLELLHKKRMLQSIMRSEVPWDQIGLPIPDACNLELCTANIRNIEDCRQLMEEIQALVNRISALPDHEETLARLTSLNEKIMAHSLSLFRELKNGLEELTDSERICLLTLRDSIAAQTNLDRTEIENYQSMDLLYRSVPTILKHFPLWAVTNLSASRVPLVPAMFDYLIIDEANVCDIPSAIPLFARAKQVVLVGDPAQEHHVTKLSITREQELLSKNGLIRRGVDRFTYREISLFDLASNISNASCHTLRQHYRCHKGIADYFNQTFYGGRLTVVTDQERLLIPADEKPGLHWTNVTGPIIPAGSGYYVPAEIDAIMEYLKEILIARQFAGTVGVVTGFREQANRLMDRISAEIPTDTILKSNLAAFTAQQYQGNERDVIALSLCVGPDVPVANLIFLDQRANLLNVVVSRAKAVCKIFGDVEFARNSGAHHLSALVTTAEKSSKDGYTSPSFESPWEESLYMALASRGLRTIPQYPLAGLRLDLALILDDLKIDIVVDGSAYHRNPDGTRRSGDLWRDAQTTSLGWLVKRFWVHQLKENMEACVDDIVNTISGHRKRD